MYSDLHKVTKIRHSYKEIFLIIILLMIDWLGVTVKFRKQAPPCISPSKYKPPKIVMQKTLH